MRYCSKCGAEFPDASKFCDKCGAELENVQNAVSAQAPANFTPPNYAAAMPMQAVQQKQRISAFDIIMKLAAIVLMFFNFVSIKFIGEFNLDLNPFKLLQASDDSKILKILKIVASVTGDSVELNSLLNSLYYIGVVMVASIAVLIIAFIVLICGKINVSKILSSISLLAYLFMAIATYEILSKDSPFEIGYTWSFIVVAIIAFLQISFSPVLGKVSKINPHLIISTFLAALVILTGFLLTSRDTLNSIVPAIIGIAAGAVIIAIGVLLSRRNKSKSSGKEAAWICRCGYSNSGKDIICGACKLSRYWTCDGCGNQNENNNNHCISCGKYHG